MHVDLNRLVVKKTAWALNTPKNDVRVYPLSVNLYKKENFTTEVQDKVLSSLILWDSSRSWDHDITAEQHCLSPAASRHFCYHQKYQWQSHSWAQSACWAKEHKWGSRKAAAEAWRSIWIWHVPGNPGHPSQWWSWRAPGRRWAAPRT